jgi:hypothetical protein
MGEYFPVPQQVLQSPAPPQVAQGLEPIFPVPLQSGQSPLPPHTGQSASQEITARIKHNDRTTSRAVTIFFIKHPLKKNRR